MAKKPTDLDDVLHVIADFSTMVAARFDQQDARFDQQDAKFFRIEQNIEELKSEIGTIHQKIDHIYGVLDAHMKRIEDILVDNKVRDHQQERMERWIFQLAEAADIKLKYD